MNVNTKSNSIAPETSNSVSSLPPSPHHPTSPSPHPLPNPEPQMVQNGAECCTENSQLRDRQLAAIDLLVAGRSDIEIAFALGLHRNTISRWRLHNPLFQAELNRRRQALWHNSADRLRSLLSPAMDILEKQLKDPYEHTAIRAATAVLRMAGAQKIAPPIGPTDEDEILKNLVLAQRQQYNPENDELPPTEEELTDMLHQMLEKSGRTY